MSTLRRPARVEIEQFAGYPLARQLHVAGALAGGEARMQLRRFGVDEVGGQGAGVEAEQGVGERAVPPVEAGQVQPHE